MAKEHNVYVLSLSSEGHGDRRTGNAYIGRQMALLLLLLFLSGTHSWPWSFNNTCIEDHDEYGSNCEDTDFQKILDENSIIVDNSTGIIGYQYKQIII